MVVTIVIVLLWEKEIEMIEINKIYNDDCINMMSKMPCNFIDGVITSPPYNIIRPNSTDRGYDEYKDGMSNEDFIDWQLSLFNEFDRVLKFNGCVCFNISYGTENTTAMSLLVADIIRKTNFTLADCIIWKKQSATPNNVSKNKLTRICEHIYIFCRKDEFYTFNANKKVLSVRDTGQNIYENVFNFIEAKNNDETQDLNKATFSTDLVKKLIDIYFSKGNLICDTFMGTGTTAVACKQKELNFIGSELSKAQCEYAEERLLRTSGEVGLFQQGEFYFDN